MVNSIPTDGKVIPIHQAYSNGYLEGIKGIAADVNPFEESSTLFVAWEAGWDDGFELHKMKKITYPYNIKKVR
jgi:ribosome modulation factor